MSKTQFWILSALLTVIFSAWGYLYFHHWQMASRAMSGMWLPPSGFSAWGFMDFALVFMMWAIMMAAMMLPSAIPMALAFSHVSRQRQTTIYRPTIVFVLAYLCVWLGFSIVLTLLQWQMHGLAWLSPRMENKNPLLAAVILILAGIYQFLSFKNTCLRFCRSPMTFLLNEWHEGLKGAFKMGFKHGAACVGCCWAQMLIMFAVGVMNLLGMAFITFVVILEKLTPADTGLIRTTCGFAFVLWGLYFLAKSYARFGLLV